MPTQGSVFSALLTTGLGCPSSLCFTRITTKSDLTWLGEHEYVPPCDMVIEEIVSTERKVRLVTGDTTTLTPDTES